MWSNGRSEASVEASLPAPIEIRRLKAARRLRLRFDAATGTLKLTCPWRQSRRSALAWALDQRAWIEAQMASAPAGEPFRSGMSFPIEGRDVRLLWQEDWPRTPRLVGDELRCGGPEAGVAGRVESFLKRRAREAMSDDIAGYAAQAGVQPAAVTVGDAATRWGSCSSNRRIRMSWRLILAPPEVRRYVAAHEVAHLVHLNHGQAFKALEASLYGPGVAAAKAELARIGPRLRVIGRL
jgi:predicted metal-dependent hydrolase